MNAKPRLIILSDLWGGSQPSWLAYYIALLKNTCQIQYYDCCQLGQLDTHTYTQDNLHQQFVNGGIAKAVKHLLERETEKISVLAFSIGGAIAWKAALHGLELKSLIAVSSTRLRYEKERPNASISLFFGEQDQYKPEEYWFELMDVKPQVFEQARHELYQEEGFAKKICYHILQTI